jgi:hypothetical protein
MSNSYQKMTVQNPSFVKRFSHTRRFVIALDLLNFIPADTFLDFGSGDGYIISMLEQRSCKPESIIAFEPIADQYLQLKTLLNEVNSKAIAIDNLSLLPALRFSKISCLEVLEHLNHETLSSTLSILRGLLAEGGQLVVSVPIETGMAGFSKNLVRFALGQAHEGASLSSILKSLFSMRIERPDHSYIGSHIGFNHKNLEFEFIKFGLKILTKKYSPIPALGGAINSQVFYVLRKEAY